MTLAKIKHKIQQLKIGIGSPVATDRIRGWELTKIRKRILLRDLYTCQVCGFISTNLEVDHIIPLHLGGPESDYNRQSICSDCHAKKSSEEEQGRAVKSLRNEIVS